MGHYLLLQKGFWTQVVCFIPMSDSNELKLVIHKQWILQLIFMFNLSMSWLSENAFFPLEDGEVFRKIGTGLNYNILFTRR